MLKMHQEIMHVMAYGDNKIEVVEGAEELANDFEF